MTTPNNETLANQRLIAANEARADYDFGEQTTGLGNWFAEEADHLFCFLAQGKKPISLHVLFEGDTANLLAVYACGRHGEHVGFSRKINQSEKSQAIIALYRALRARWIAAGMPACATQMCLWDMEGLISYTNKTDESRNEALTEGIELLEAWIENGAEQTIAELIALEKAKKALE